MVRLQEESDENNEIIQTTMVKLLKEKLDISPEIDVVHRMGKQLDNKPTPVIVRLRTFRERQECFKLSLKLKGKNIYINEDISKATLDIRKTKLRELKEKRQQGFIAYFSGTELIVKPRKNSSQQTKEAENNASRYTGRKQDDSRTADKESKSAYWFWTTDLCYI